MTLYIQMTSIAFMFLGLAFAGITVMEYFRIRHESGIHNSGIYRVQSGLVFLSHLAAFGVLIKVHNFEKQVVLLYLFQLGLLVLVDIMVEHVFKKSSQPLWAIGQYLLMISFVMMTRLSLDLGYKQLYMASLSFAIAFVVAWLYPYIPITKYLGIPAILVAYTLLVMNNATINGATNWLTVGGFTFQPSEPVKILYMVFLASFLVTFKMKEHMALLITGIFTFGLVMIQVFQRDLGSALIFYVVFILMTYVYTTNRLYILGGAIVTGFAGFFAYNVFSHVQVRIHAWLDPWSDIDTKGYQIAQSLFAIANGGLSGTGLTLGQPNKIPVVTTDFIYSAIFEELGLVIGLVILVLFFMILVYGIKIIEHTNSDFDFLLGSGIVMILAFQSLLIIGGVTKAIPLTGVTLPFISYGGSSLTTTFTMLGILQGISIGLSLKKTHKKREEELHEEG